MIDDPTYATTLAELRELAPVDSRCKQFVRHGRYKAAIDTQDGLELYDILHVASGIGEPAEVSAEQPESVARIRDYLRHNDVAARYSSLPWRRD